MSKPRRARGETREGNGDIRRWLPVIISTILLAAPASSGAATLIHRIHHAKLWTWRYQAALGNCCRPYGRAAERTDSFDYRRWLLVFWRGRERHAGARWHDSPVRSALLCIHGGEGAWTANTGNGYFGGLQMDVDFMFAYGAEYLQAYGTADHWSPLEQLTAGARAVRVRGYGPWPLTRIPCGV